MMIALMFYVSVPKINKNEKNLSLDEKISFNEINNIIKYRCGVCHATKPTFDGFDDPPLGIIFETPEDIINNIDKIKAQAIDLDIMPPGNLTGMTNNERNNIDLWIKQGANISN